MTGSSLRVAIDIGGTFTDLVLLEASTGALSAHKLLTTPDDPGRAVIQGLTELVEREGYARSDVATVIHGTTLATNAIVERRGARVALVTTRGFRDVLEIGRERRYGVHNTSVTMPPPLVPRHLRYEVHERIDADGTVVTALTDAALAELVASLDAQHVDAIAISLINSYVNPLHEQEVAKALAQATRLPYLSLSSDVNPEMREYERTCTTAINAYVQPVIANYLRNLSDRLRATGYGAELFMMLSDGGTATAEVAANEPIRIIESGPVGGAIAAAYFAGGADTDNVIAFDMGGTTAKMCIIQEGRLTLTGESEVGREQWNERGSGYTMRAPTVDLIELGTGGGSIARISDTGLLKVGPRSSGAVPGPASYGIGGLEPTVTDADLVLGYLNPQYFVGGSMPLQASAAEEAIASKIATPLGLSLPEVAWGIHTIANEDMAVAARLYTLQQGRDPAGSVLVTSGGAGPIHAAGIAKLLGARRVIYPLSAGVASALGFLLTPISIRLSQGYVAEFDHLDFSVVERIYEQLRDRAVTLLLRAGVPAAEIEVEKLVSLCYVGQGYEVETPLPADYPAGSTHDELIESFTAMYERIYGRTPPSRPLKAVAWRLLAHGPRPRLETDGHLLWNVTKQAARQCPPRPAYFPESGGFIECPVIDRLTLQPGQTIKGPVIVEEIASTAVLPPGFTATVDDMGSLVAEPDRGPA